MKNPMKGFFLIFNMMVLGLAGVGFGAEMFGAEYLPLGFATARGKYFAVGDGGLGSHPLQPPPPGSIESFFVATGQPRLILDLRQAQPESEGSGWLTEARPFRFLGALAMEQQFQPQIITHSFDVLIYIENTTAAVQLDTPPPPPGNQGK